MLKYLSKWAILELLIERQFVITFLRRKSMKIITDICDNDLEVGDEVILAINNHLRFGEILSFRKDDDGCIIALISTGSGKHERYCWNIVGTELII